MVALGEIVTIKGGGTPDKSVTEYWDGDIPWASVKDFKSSELAFTSDSITALGVQNSATNVIPAGNIIVPTRMAVGKAAINTVDLAINQDLKALFPKSNVEKRYLLHALLALSSKLEEQATGATVKGITLEVLRSLQIPLPTLDEQKRIAAILDQADALHRLRQKSLDRLNDLSQAIFYEMFGDPKSNPRGLPWVALGKVADFYSGNSLPDGETFIGQGNGHLLLKVSDLNHELNQQNIVCSASWSATPGSRAGTCPPNALIFPKRGGAIGTNKKRWLKRSAILDPNLMGVLPNEKDMIMSFLNGWFQTFNLTDIASGSSVPQLNKQDLAPLEIALPPLIEQMEYANRMKALATVRDGIVRAFECDEQLFSALQHRAFRGEL